MPCGYCSWLGPQCWCFAMASLPVKKRISPGNLAMRIASIRLRFSVGSKHYKPSMLCAVDGERGEAMIRRIHILGASGSGTTTLGRALAERLQYPHFDTDDYFWLPTDPPYTQQRERTERAQLLMDDIPAQDSWVLSGSLCGWGDVAIPLFALVVFLWIPQDIRMERL